MYRVWLQAECIAGAMSVLSIHSPDYVFTVLVSIFIGRTHNHFLSTLVYIVGVAANVTNHVRTYLCLQHYVSSTMSQCLDNNYAGLQTF